MYEQRDTSVRRKTHTDYRDRGNWGLGSGVHLKTTCCYEVLYQQAKKGKI